MQAGESLSFITIPNELSVPEVRLEEEKEAVWKAFATLVQRVMITYPDSFQSIEQPEESGTVTITEGSFQVAFADGSYIHIVAYGHSDEEGIIDLGLTLVEHSDEGVYLGGYLYDLSDSDVMCSRLYTSTEDDEEDTHYHFSLIAIHEGRSEIDSLRFSDNEDVRALAEENWRQVEEASQIGQMEKELGFSSTTPTLEDIEKIEALLSFAVPFVAPTSY